jgi:hypothetical protein
MPKLPPGRRWRFKRLLLWTIFASTVREPGRHYVGRSAPSRTAMIVASMVAVRRSSPLVDAKTSASTTVSVRPGRMTAARAMNRSPVAGANRLILYSTVNTDASAGMRLYAA